MFNYELFKTMCAERGFAPSRIGDAVGVHIDRACVSRWKTKGFSPAPGSMKAIADYFGVDIDYFETDKDDEDIAEVEVVDDGGLPQEFRPAVAFAGKIVPRLGRVCCGSYSRQYCPCSPTKARFLNNLAALHHR